MQETVSSPRRDLSPGQGWCLPRPSLLCNSSALPVWEWEKDRHFQISMTPGWWVLQASS